MRVSFNSAGLLARENAIMMRKQTDEVLLRATDAQIDNLKKSAKVGSAVGLLYLLTAMCRRNNLVSSIFKSIGLASAIAFPTCVMLSSGDSFHRSR